MAEHAVEHHRGEMDIRAQQATYAGVMKATKWASLALVVGLVFFILWLCAGAGFGSALITALVVLALGVVALKDRRPAH